MHSNTSRAGVPESVIEKNRERLSSYMGKLRAAQNATEYKLWEGSIKLPFDTSILAEVEATHKALESKTLKYVVVVGIGGSNLGAKALYDALWGSYESFEAQRYPKLLWADTSEPLMLERLLQPLLRCSSPEEYVVIYTSKSGTTSETALNASLLWHALGAKKNRWVVISDAISPLTKEAKALGIRTITLPEPVGGRFSVLTAAGLLPLRFLTTNLRELVKGAQEMAEQCTKDTLENPALLGASALLHAKSQGLRVHDTCIFHPQLESLGKWYRQLLGESIGKEKDRGGKVVHEGILPTVTIGSTDLHSIGQLYLGGPRMSFTTFISALTSPKMEHEKPETPWEKVTPGVRKKTPGELMTAIRDGVQMAYTQRDLPFIDVRWDSISLKELGGYMQWKMIEVMYMAELLNINAFDQPAVELYKSETRKILAGS